MNFGKDITACLEVLSRGGIVLYPTDTVWGLGCDATNRQAVQKILSVKKKKQENGLIILVADENMLAGYTKEIPLQAKQLIRSYGKPLTIIYQNGMNLPENVLGKDGSIAARIPQDDFCLHLLQRFGKPLVSTSANVSGESVPPSFREISSKIKLHANYIVQYRQNKNSVAKPSSIVKISPDGKMITLRD